MKWFKEPLISEFVQTSSFAGRVMSPGIRKCFNRILMDEDQLASKIVARWLKDEVTGDARIILKSRNWKAVATGRGTQKWMRPGSAVGCSIIGERKNFPSGFRFSITFDFLQAFYVFFLLWFVRQEIFKSPRVYPYVPILCFWFSCISL